MRDLGFQSVVKTFKTLFLTQKPKFPIPRTLIAISQKIISRTNYFPRILCFSPAISHIHKSTKMGFPGNQPKITQLHKNITSSKMVVRGWYMTHFDRRDLLNSKKKFGIVSTTYMTSPDRFAIFLDFFLEIPRWAADPRKPNTRTHY